jgi:hypothetical protein
MKRNSIHGAQREIMREAQIMTAQPSNHKNASQGARRLGISQPQKAAFSGILRYFSRKPTGFLRKSALSSAEIHLFEVRSNFEIEIFCCNNENRGPRLTP